MKLLGIDYGTKRIGLATGDTDMSLAFPLRTVANDRDAIAAIGKVIAEEGITQIVLGMPTRLAGTGDIGETEQAVNRFLFALTDATDIPIVTEDERMTSAIAERRRREAGLKRKDFDIDAEAAAVMLEGYMERQKGSHADLS